MKVVLFVAVFVLAFLAVPSQATPVGGFLAIQGGDTTLGQTFVTFLCDIVAAKPCPGGSGNFFVGGAAVQTGSFIPYANDTGFVKSLDFTTQKPNTAISVSNFLTFNPAGTVIPPDIALDLTFIQLGTSGQAQCAAPANPNQTPSQTCTPIFASLINPMSDPLGLSPLNLANTPSGSTASFAVMGNARRISTNEISPFNGTFSVTFTSTPGTTDGSYQAVLAALNTGGTISSSYSATFNATIIPEPETVALVLGGLLILVGSARRSRFRRRAVTRT